MAPKSTRRSTKKTARKSARRSAKKTTRARRSAKKSTRRSVRKTCKSGKRRSRKSGRCKISPAKKYSTRKRSPGRPKKKEAPRESAKDFPEGTLKKGNDGFYKVQVDSKGRHTWKKCSASVNGRVNCRHNRPSVTPFGLLDVFKDSAVTGVSINRRNAMVPASTPRRNATVGTPASTPTITQGLLELFQPKVVTEPAPQPKSQQLRLPAPPRQLLLGAPPKQSRSRGFGKPPTINTSINTAQDFYTPQTSMPSVYDWSQTPTQNTFNQTPASVSGITNNPQYEGPASTPKKSSSFFGLF